MKPQRKPQTPETHKAALASGHRMSTAELAENEEWFRKHPEREPTRKDVANTFKRLRGQITEKLNALAYSPDARSLAREYVTFQQVIDHARGHCPDGPALPEMPVLIGNDFYAGLVCFADYCRTAADVLDGRKAPTAKGGKADSKKQPWADDAPEFLPNSEALKLDSAGQLDLKKLGRLLTPKGDIRYMRKGRRCKIHLGDFRHYLSAQKGGTVTDEAIDEYLRGVERRKEEVDRRKRAAR